MKTEAIKFELVGAETMMEMVWPNEKDRPSLRTLANWQRLRIIPFVKLGGRVYFNVEDVSEAVRRRCTVKAMEIA